MEVASEKCPTHETSFILLEVLCSKNLNLSEFAISALSKLVKSADASFFSDSQELIELVGAMVKVLESKKPRMVKYANPILLDVQTRVGKDKLHEIVKRSLLFQNQASSGEQNEGAEDLKETE